MTTETGTPARKPRAKKADPNAPLSTVAIVPAKSPFRQEIQAKIEAREAAALPTAESLIGKTWTWPNGQSHTIVGAFSDGTRVSSSNTWDHSTEIHFVADAVAQLAKYAPEQLAGTVDGEGFFTPSIDEEKQEVGAADGPAALIGRKWTDEIGRVWTVDREAPGEPGMMVGVCDDPDVETESYHFEDLAGILAESEVFPPAFVAETDITIIGAGTEADDQYRERQLDIPREPTGLQVDKGPLAGLIAELNEALQALEPACYDALTKGTIAVKITIDPQDSLEAEVTFEIAVSGPKVKVSRTYFRADMIVPGLPKRESERQLTIHDAERELALVPAGLIGSPEADAAGLADFVGEMLEEGESALIEDDEVIA